MLPCSGEPLDGTGAVAAVGTLARLGVLRAPAGRSAVATTTARRTPGRRR